MPPAQAHVAEDQRAGSVAPSPRTLARLRPRGAELLREVANYEDEYRLCYLRGPAGIIVALSERVDLGRLTPRKPGARRAFI